ncbi:MAG: DNA repair protein RadC [Clostridium sp.]|nr:MULTISPECIES: DNA repair protein RadC [Clostridium]EEH99604.2 DNA repair protein RadC [Clostridium sp. 7_2_43FAA]MDU2683602.1 DNA repair protein RadC [Clostridium sp.]
MANKMKSKVLNRKRVDIVSIKMVKESSFLYENRRVNSSVDAIELFKRFLNESDREQFLVCCMDIKNQPTSINVVSIGTLNSSLVHPREVFKVAILANSASIIVAHNHPSGDPTPSEEDINITIRLKEAGKIIGIDILDHVIIGENKHISFKEKGIL